MFGYITPHKPSLTFAAFDDYKAVYCSLCRALGRRYGSRSRLTLNFDFTFLAVVLLALEDEVPRAATFRCGLSPHKRRMRINAPHRALDYAADASVAIVYHKLLDDIADGEAGAKTRAAKGFLKPLYKKCKRQNLEICRICEELTAAQSELEARPSSGIDAAAEPSARALSRLCENYFYNGEADGAGDRRSPLQASEEYGGSAALGRFGYFIGRYVYLIDALDDREKDSARGRFNPFSEVAPDLARESINATIAAAQEAYERLEIKHERPLLDNIVYAGLAARLKQLVN